MHFSKENLPELLSLPEEVETVLGQQDVCGLAADTLIA